MGGGDGGALSQGRKPAALTQEDQLMLRLDCAGGVELPAPVDEHGSRVQQGGGHGRWQRRWVGRRTAHLRCGQDATHRVAS